MRLVRRELRVGRKETQCSTADITLATGINKVRDNICDMFVGDAVHLNDAEMLNVLATSQLRNLTSCVNIIGASDEIKDIIHTTLRGVDNKFTVYSNGYITNIGVTEAKLIEEMRYDVLVEVNFAARVISVTPGEDRLLIDKIKDRFEKIKATPINAVEEILLEDDAAVAVATREMCRILNDYKPNEGETPMIGSTVFISNFDNSNIADALQNSCKHVVLSDEKLSRFIPISEPKRDEPHVVFELNKYSESKLIIRKCGIESNIAQSIQMGFKEVCESKEPMEKEFRLNVHDLDNAIEVMCGILNAHNPLEKTLFVIGITSNVDSSTFSTISRKLDDKFKQVSTNERVVNFIAHSKPASKDHIVTIELEKRRDKYFVIVGTGHHASLNI